MNDVGSLNARIEALETRIAHQERTIEDLNRSVTEQWERIDALTRQAERMAARLQQIEGNVPSGEDEAPPPHY
jgi:SlyX protein